MPAEEYRKAPFLRLLFPLIGGIILGRNPGGLPYFYWSCIACSAVLLLASLWQRRTGGYTLLSAFLFVGMALGRMPETADVPEGVFSARVCGDIVPSGRGSRTLVDRICILEEDRWKSVHGGASVYLADWPVGPAGEAGTGPAQAGTDRPGPGSVHGRLQPGSRILARGKLRPWVSPMNPGQFDYGRFQRGRGIRYRVYLDPVSWRPAGPAPKPGLRIRALLVRRAWIDALEARIGDGGQRAILSALLLGYREEMDPSLRQDFADSGTLHVLAVSGLHVGILYLLPALLLRRLKPFPAARITGSLLVFTGLWMYAFLTGLSSSVIRAVSMCCIHGLAVLNRRRVSPLHVISLAAFGMILSRPPVVFEAGFQLSFAAVTGIACLYPRFMACFPLRGIIGRRVAQMLSVSLSAQLSTLPLSVYYFNRFAPVSVLLNLLVIPLATLILYTGLFFFLLEGLETLPGGLAWFCGGGESLNGTIAFLWGGPRLPRGAAGLLNGINGLFNETTGLLGDGLAALLGALASFLEWFTGAVAGLPGACIGGLSLLPSQVILLFVAGILGLRYMGRRTAGSLFLLLSSILVFLSISCVREFRIRSDQGFYVFALNGETAIGFVRGRQSVLFRGFDPPPGDPGSLPREIEPFYRRHKLDLPVILAAGGPDNNGPPAGGDNTGGSDIPARRLTPDRSNSPAGEKTFPFCRQIRSPGMEALYAVFGDRRILILSRLDGDYSGGLPALQSDLLVLCNNPRADIPALAKHLHTSCIVADGSNHRAYTRRIESACRRAGMAFHSTAFEGCFIY